MKIIATIQQSIWTLLSL